MKNFTEIITDKLVASTKCIYLPFTFYFGTELKRKVSRIIIK